MASGPRRQGELMDVRDAPAGTAVENVALDGRPVRELLALHNVSKSWGERKVLDDLELILDCGTLTSISGTNGIGKTTMLRIAVGLIMPDEGIVDLDGLHPRRDRRRYQSRIGFLAAGDRGLYARLTVRRHLELWGRLSLLSTKRIGAAVDRTVTTMGLEGLVDHRVDRLSMGQRQRLRIAMVFMHQPDVVLLDEPINSLDEDGSRRLGRALGELTERGGAALWCSPGNDVVPVVFDRQLQLEDGKLVQVGGS
jgi:ABC-2 type transport system ATP-binding protein